MESGSPRVARPDILWGLVALAAALVIGLWFVSGAVRDLRRAGDQVSVTGSARRPIRSDFAIWRGSVAAQAPTLQSAATTLQEQAGQVRDFLREQGVADSSLTVRPIETWAVPEFTANGRETGRVVGYRLTQWFEVRSLDIDAITRLSQQSGTLISRGVPLVSSPPEYHYTKLAEVRVSLLADATKDARDRAVAIAEAAGGTVGVVREARMGVFQITPRYSTEVSDYGINDLSSIDKDVTAVVRVNFTVR